MGIKDWLAHQLFFNIHLWILSIMLYKQDHQLTLAHLCPKGIVKSCQLLGEQGNYRTFITFFKQIWILLLISLLCLLWLSSDSPTLYHTHTHTSHYSITLHVSLSAQQQLQRPLHSLISLSTVPTDPSHTHRALHQNPYTPILHQLTLTTARLTAPWFPPIFLQSTCSAAKNQHQLHLACSWCASCPMMPNVPSTQPGTILTPQAGRGEE